MADSKNYSGGCHCGQVRYDVTADLSQIMACNCSICTKRGALWVFVSPEHFALRAGTDHLVDYQFHMKKIHHLFCRECGVGAFSRGQKPDGSEMIAINVRCLDGIDVSALKTTPYDGKNI
jgi:hypothetical protein